MTKAVSLLSIAVAVLAFLIATTERARIKVTHDLQLMTVERNQWKAESNAQYNRPK